MAEAGFVPAKAALFGAAFLFLAGCAGPESFGGSRAAATSWAQERGFTASRLEAGAFHLLALTRQRAGTDLLTVYIEGDGAPWATPWHPPRDPTPIKPTALALAAADPAPAVAYLGRPCQYLDPAELARCDAAYWIDRRFAPEVVAAYDQALTRLKASSGATRLRLVGYSGGGVVAALLAGRRQDVEHLVTVAAPLALADWVARHELSPLAGSLDPAKFTEPLPPSVHFAGGDDKTVPAGVVAGFVRQRGGRLETVAGFDHECCWARDWAVLLPSALSKENSR